MIENLIANLNKQGKISHTLKCPDCANLGMKTLEKKNFCLCRCSKCAHLFIKSGDDYERI